MNSDLRIIPLEQHDAAMNMAVDEAMLHFISQKKSLPTLRFYTWKPAAISLGYFQSLEEEVDSSICQAQGVDIVRRITGGGAVLHDQEITYSLIIPENTFSISKDILVSYQQICGALVHAFSSFSIQSVFSPINDILINNQKISGNAQTRRQGCILQHGTILLDVDVEKMFSLLKVPDEKKKGKLIEDIKQRVTSMKHQLSRKVTAEEMIIPLKEGFEKALQAALQTSVLTSEELVFAEHLKKTKYLNDAWTKMR